MTWKALLTPPGLKRFALLGISQGCAVSIVYAIRHPERVSHLVLYGGFARGRRQARSGSTRGRYSRSSRQGWGKENPAYRQFFTSLFFPGRHARADAMVQRFAADDDLARKRLRIMRATGELDISDLLSQVNVPTLVLHCRNDAGCRLMKDADSPRVFPARNLSRSKAAITWFWKASPPGINSPAR